MGNAIADIDARTAKWWPVYTIGAALAVVTLYCVALLSPWWQLTGGCFVAAVTVAYVLPRNPMRRFFHAGGTCLGLSVATALIPNIRTKVTVSPTQFGEFVLENQSGASIGFIFVAVVCFVLDYFYTRSTGAPSTGAGSSPGAGASSTALVLGTATSQLSQGSGPNVYAPGGIVHFHQAPLAPSALPDATSSLAPTRHSPSNVPTPSRTFIARRVLTAKIHAAFQVHPNQTVIRQAVTRALGGYGKTVAAILYADQYKDDYPAGRFFLPLGSSDLAIGLAGLAARLAPPATSDPAADAKRVKEALESGEPSLLILDNIADAATWQAMCASGLVPRGACRVLVTTRDETIDAANAIRVDRLTHEEAREVYRLFCADRRSRADDPPPLPADAVADAVTDWLGGLAVSIAAVAAYMKLKPHIAWAVYWEGDGDRLRGLRNTPVSELPDVRPEVAAQLGIDGAALEAHRRTLRVIDDAFDALPAAERRAVEYAALLPQDLAPAQWIETLLDTDAARTAGALKIHMPADPDDPSGPARLVLTHLDRLDVLVSTGEEGKLLSLHRLWAQRITERIRSDESIDLPLFDSVEVLIFDLEEDWRDQAVDSVCWGEVIALHVLSLRMSNAGRISAQTAARTAIRRVIPSIPLPTRAIHKLAVLVAESVGRELE